MRSLLTLLLLVSTPVFADESTATPASSSYLGRRAAHVTKLNAMKKPPMYGESLSPPGGVSAIKYPSGDLELKAWFQRPKKAAKDEKVPAVVYFHAGFAFKMEDWTNTAAFRDAGYAVLCPMLRAENGNPGRYELFYGEIDDARAAIRWLAKQPGIDPDRI
ncbi:MAG: alpha/beta hydrolase family protein [Planctomycetota bacterium]